VARAIREGRSVDEVADRVENCLYKTLRQIHKELPFADMIRALDSPDDLAKVLQNVAGGTDVKEFLMQAAALERISRSGKLERFLGDALNNCLYDIPYMATDADRSRSITEVRRILAAVPNRLSENIQRLASRLAENPDKVPPRRRRGGVTQSKDELTTDMLGESLLARSKK
jgi:hypothetical protein